MAFLGAWMGSLFVDWFWCLLLPCGRKFGLMTRGGASSVAVVIPVAITASLVMFGGTSHLVYYDTMARA